MKKFNEEYTPVRLTASGQVLASKGIVGGFLVASGTPTITLYDSLTGSGTVILNAIVTIAGTPYPFPARVANGCYAVLSGAGDVTFFAQKTSVNT